MPGKDLRYKPGVAEKAKFEYSSIGKVSNKGLEKDDKKERLLKSLKNIEGKNKAQLKEIEDSGKRQLSTIRKQRIKQQKGHKKTKQLKNCWKIDCLIKIWYFLIMFWTLPLKEKLLIRALKR